MTEPSTRRQHKRPRPQSSCAICHKRKVKCSKTLPCLQCQKHKCADECRYDGLQPPIVTTTETSPGPLAADGPTAGVTMQDVDEAEQAKSGSLYELAETSRKEVLALIQAGQLTSRTKSKYATHDWIYDSKRGPLRGRTHTTGILRHFDPLMIYVGRTSLSDSGPEYDGNNVQGRHKKPNFQDHTMSSLYADMGPLNTSRELVSRYFETWHTVFPLVNRDLFERQYGDMLVDPHSTTICFVIRTLLIMALANATYAPGEAPVTLEKIARWLDAASCLPTSLVESGEIHEEALRGVALFNLAELVLSADSTACYIKSGTTVRTAMTLSLHRCERDEDADLVSPLDQFRLWNTIVELDQHACLAAGMPPSVPEPTFPEGDTVQVTDEADILRDLEQHRLRVLLEKSLPIRHRILAALNGKKHLMFEDVVELSTALTKAFAPVSTRQDIPAAARTFQYEYVFYVYRRFMSALHRLFGDMDGEPATYISRGMAVRLARRHMLSVCNVWHGTGDTSPFAALLTGNGTMFRTETCHAIFTISLELYREADELQAALLSVEDGRSGLNETFQSFFGILEQKVAKKEVPAKAFLIPAMVYAHNRISATHQVNSSEYCRAMAEAGAEAAKFAGLT